RVFLPVPSSSKDSSRPRMRWQYRLAASWTKSGRWEFCLRDFMQKALDDHQQRRRHGCVLFFATCSAPLFASTKSHIRSTAHGSFAPPLGTYARGMVNHLWECSQKVLFLAYFIQRPIRSFL
ncbi:unnamed protein product, partial [Scytosiphon promiscuus]